MTFEDDIIQNAKFQSIYDNELVRNPWLQNNLYGTVDVDGEPGTVYSGSYKTSEGKERVIPTILPNRNNDGAFLERIKDFEEAKNINKEYGYGIDFDTSTEATEFSKWLSNKHKKYIEKSYGK